MWYYEELIICHIIIIMSIYIGNYLKDRLRILEMGNASSKNI